MKLFDSAARGRATVISAGVSCVPGGTPPGTYVVEHANQWADAVTAAENEPAEEAACRIAGPREYLGVWLASVS